MNEFTVKIPDTEITRLVEATVRAVEQTLQVNLDKIQSEPKLLSRKETAAMLKISLPTLRKYELNGTLIPQRGGWKLLYPKKTVEDYLNRG